MTPEIRLPDDPASVGPASREFFALQAVDEAFAISKDYGKFVRESWPIIEPGTRYLHNWHIDCIAEYLQAVRLSQIQDLIINIQPRAMKSILVTVDFAPWWWTSEPERRFMFTSFSDGLVKKHSVDRRAIIESQWYQDRWGASSQWSKKVILASDQNEKKEFLNTYRGSMVAAPIGGQLTGKGGDVIIIDDPQSPDDADSDVKRLSAQAFVEGTLYTRLDDKIRGRKIIVMQRLHEKDLTGHELSKGNWTLLCLPAECDHKTVIEFPISKREKIRQKGEVLWPEREPQSILERTKIGMTQTRFSGQYNQSPAPAEGNLLKRAWWRWYGLGTGVSLPEEFDYVFDSWDMTFKKKSATEKKANKPPDYVVGTKWGVKGADFFLIYVRRERMSFTEARDSVHSLALTKPYPSAVLIEDTANGPATIDSLATLISGITPINVGNDKVERASGASPVLRAGNIYLPVAAENAERAPFVGGIEACVDEAAVFPNGENDDFVDSWSQAVNWYIKNFGGMLAWVNRRAEEIERKQAEQKEETGGRRMFEKTGDERVEKSFSSLMTGVAND